MLKTNLLYLKYHLGAISIESDVPLWECIHYFRPIHVPLLPSNAQ